MWPRLIREPCIEILDSIDGDNTQQLEMVVHICGSVCLEDVLQFCLGRHVRMRCQLRRVLAVRDVIDVARRNTTGALL